MTKVILESEAQIDAGVDAHQKLYEKQQRHLKAAAKVGDLLSTAASSIAAAGRDACGQASAMLAGEEDGSEVEMEEEEEAEAEAGAEAEAVIAEPANAAKPAKAAKLAKAAKPVKVAKLAKAAKPPKTAKSAKAAKEVIDLIAAAETLDRMDELQKLSKASSAAKRRKGLSDSLQFLFARHPEEFAEIGRKIR